MFRNSKNASPELLLATPVSPRPQQEESQTVDLMRQMAAFESWPPFDVADSSYSFTWGGYEALFLGVHIINRYNGLGLEVLKVDSQGTAGANGVLKGDYLVALNGRTIPTNMPDKDLAHLFHTLPRPFVLCFRRPQPSEGLSAAGITWESPTKRPQGSMNSASTQQPGGSVGWETWAAASPRSGSKSPRGQQQQLSPRMPRSLVKAPSFSSPEQVDTFDPFASPRHQGSRSSSSSAFAVGDGVSVDKGSAVFVGVVEALSSSGAAADVRLTNTGSLVQNIPVARLKPNLQTPKNPFDDWPATYSESPTGKPTTAQRPLTPRSPIRSPRGLGAAANTTSGATAFDPFASFSPKAQGGGRLANPFEAFPPTLLPPMAPPAPPPSHSMRGIPGAAAVANSAFDFAEMCTVDGDTASRASDSSAQDLTPFFPAATTTNSQHDPFAPPNPPATATSRSGASPRTLNTAWRRARRASAVAEVEAQLRAALCATGQPITAAALALALTAEENLEMSLEEEDVDLHGVAYGAEVDKSLVEAAHQALTQRLNYPHRKPAPVAPIVPVTASTSRSIKPLAPPTPDGNAADRAKSPLSPGKAVFNYALS